MSNERKQQDFVTNKLLIVFTMVFVGIFATMYLYRMSNANAEGYLGVISIVNALFYSCTVGTVASGVKWYLDRNKEKENPYKLITAKNLCSVLIVMTICFGFAKVFTILSAVKYIYILLTAIAVQYFVLVTYTKDIYLIAISNIVNLVLVYFIGSSVSKTLLYAGLSIAFLVAIAVFVKKTQENKGEFKDYLIFKKNTNYKMLMANVGILAAITVLSTVLTFVGYSIGVIIGGIYLIVIIFYNTLKLL